MNNVLHVTQAYPQAPWRRQIQTIGLFSLVLILVALVAGIYLSVTAEATTIGRNIQFMQYEIDEIKLEIADKETQLAYLTSNEVMEKRAADLGFQRPAASEVFYLVVSGYVERQPAVVAPPPSPNLPSTPALSPDYTQSLFEWLRVRVIDPAKPLSELRP